MSHNEINILQSATKRSLKVPGPIASDFLITPGEFYS